MSTEPSADFSAETLIRSFMTIILSEIGDKTFFISAILVFLGDIDSLALMSMLSASLGHILPTLLPKKWTQIMVGV
jgi:putative Ca2+/H+ antiporter (TMEM165/GDT1 family)